MTALMGTALILVAYLVAFGLGYMSGFGSGERYAQNKRGYHKWDITAGLSPAYRSMVYC